MNKTRQSNPSDRRGPLGHLRDLAIEMLSDRMRGVTARRDTETEEHDGTFAWVVYQGPDDVPLLAAGSHGTR